MFPQIDVFLDNGYTKEEMKMVWETKKILEDETFELIPPRSGSGFFGHSEAVSIETEQPITAEEVIELLTKLPGSL